MCFKITLKIQSIFYRLKHTMQDVVQNHCSRSIQLILIRIMKIIMIPLLVSFSIFVQMIKSQNCCQEKTVNKIKPKPCLNCFSLSIFQIIASCELFSFNVYVSSSSLVTFAVIWRRAVRNLSVCQNDVIRKLPG